jgi:hypothetical protein
MTGRKTDQVRESTYQSGTRPEEGTEEKEELGDPKEGRMRIQIGSNPWLL